MAIAELSFVFSTKAFFLYYLASVAMTFRMLLFLLQKQHQQNILFICLLTHSRISKTYFTVEKTAFFLTNPVVEADAERRINGGPKLGFCADNEWLAGYCEVFST